MPYFLLFNHTESLIFSYSQLFYFPFLVLIVHPCLLIPPPFNYFPSYFSHLFSFSPHIFFSFPYPLLLISLPLFLLPPLHIFPLVIALFLSPPSYCLLLRPPPCLRSEGQRSSNINRYPFLAFHYTEPTISGERTPFQYSFISSCNNTFNILFFS
jgi:hypothetical protein